MNTLRLYKSRTGFRWTYTHRNGRKLANGGQGYSRKRDMLKALGSVFRDFLTLAPGSHWLPGLNVVLDETQAAKRKPLTGKSRP